MKLTKPYELIHDSQVWEIDDLIEALTRFKDQGYTKIVTSRDFHGTALVPSKRVNMYRIPVALAGEAFKDKNLGLIGMPTGLEHERPNNVKANFGFYAILVHKTREKDLTTPKEDA